MPSTERLTNSKGELAEQNACLSNTLLDGGLDVYGGGMVMLAYGTAVRHNASGSDYDMLIATRDYVSDQVQDESIRSLVNFHNRAGRKVDVEVPFSAKLFYTFDELQSALDLRMFKSEGLVRPLNGMAEGDEYFSSDEMKLRLALNALTSANAVLPGSSHLYAKNFLEASEGSFARLIGFVAESEGVVPPTTLAGATGLLQHSQSSGAASKDYLGYDLTDQRFLGFCEQYIEGVDPG